MARKTITTEEFENRYGYKWQDLSQLKWLSSVSGYTYPMTSEANNCPALLFLKVVADFRPDFEVYEDTAPVLAEIIKRSKEAEERFHCFSWDWNCVICLSEGESLRVKRFYLDVYKKQYNESK